MKFFLWSLWRKYKEWRYERKCIKHLGMKPQKIYVTQEQYDALVAAINAPPDPETIAKFKKILDRTPPWENNETT
jgi:uncharacterized protein with GYD domain